MNGEKGKSNFSCYYNSLVAIIRQSFIWFTSLTFDNE